jgi:hypothetical protein
MPGRGLGGLVSHERIDDWDLPELRRTELIIGTCAALRSGWIVLCGPTHSLQPFTPPKPVGLQPPNLPVTRQSSRADR